jgi:uncharacterized protein YbgA (DUF1722 family)
MTHYRELRGTPIRIGISACLLGQKVRFDGAHKEVPRQELRETYEAEFMRALKVIATRGRHVNVLQHMAGYFKRQLDDESRNELQGCIEDFQKSIVPLIVPLIPIKRYARKLNVPYLAGQACLNPHPKELAPRNHV